MYISTAGLWAIKSSIDNKNSMQVEQSANSCAELALEQMRENNSFTGTGSSSINNSLCNYEVFNNGGDGRTINVSASLGLIIKKIKITTNSFNPINVVLWQNVGDF